VQKPLRMPSPPLTNLVRALPLCGALLLTAQTPSATAVVTPWCDTIPLPQADLPSITSGGVETIHQQHRANCRPLDVETPQATLHLAVAATEAQRERGLMGVPFLPVRQGMLFVFADATDQSRYFWMKNTITSLDMVFVKGDGTVTSIAARVPATAPGTPDDKVARRDGVGRYVIELGAGEAARDGLAPGVELRIPALPAK
jgi:uncharacterized membrane protein (UPF0127 family)